MIKIPFLEAFPNNFAKTLTLYTLYIYSDEVVHSIILEFDDNKVILFLVLRTGDAM